MAFSLNTHFYYIANTVDVRVKTKSILPLKPIFTSQLKIDIRVILCTNLKVHNNIAAICGDSQLFRLDFYQFLTWSHPPDLFWVTLIFQFFELSHYGLDDLMMSKIAHCVGVISKILKCIKNMFGLCKHFFIVSCMFKTTVGRVL